MKRIIIVGFVAALVLVSFLAIAPAASAKATTYTTTLTDNENGELYHHNTHITYQPDSLILVVHVMRENYQVTPDFAVYNSNERDITNTMTGNGGVLHTGYKGTNDVQGVITQERGVYNEANGEVRVDKLWIDNKKV